MAVRNLISESDVKAILNKDSLDANDSTLVNNHLIPAVSRGIETYCGRNILDAGTDLTEYCHGDGDTILQLREWPINSVTSVYYRSGSGFNESTDWATELTEDTDFYIESKRGQLIAINRTWSDAPKYYQVKYKAGWTAANMPDDIKLAVKIWVAILYQKVKSNLMGVQTHVIGDETFVYDYATDGIPKAVKGLIDSYRRLY